MIDVVDRQTRARMMSGIRGKNTSPEILVRSALHAAGFRFRLHSAKLPGRPDLCMRRYNAVVFIHGCFWHRHSGCRYTTTPGTNAAFWAEKFEKNVERDRRNVAALSAAGWRVAVIWECSIRHADTTWLISRLREWLRSERPNLVIPDTPPGSCREADQTSS